MSSRTCRVSRGDKFDISSELRIISRNELQSSIATFAKDKKSWGLWRFGRENKPTWSWRGVVVLIVEKEDWSSTWCWKCTGDFFIHRCMDNGALVRKSLFNLDNILLHLLSKCYLRDWQFTVSSFFAISDSVWVIMQAQADHHVVIYLRLMSSWMLWWCHRWMLVIHVQ